MKKLLATLITTIFMTSQMAWVLSTFFMAWGQADSGHNKDDLEFFLPLFFGDFSFFSSFYTIISLFNAISIFIGISLFFLAIYLRIFKKKRLFKAKKDFTAQELEIVKKRQKEAMEMSLLSILFSFIALIVLYVIIMNNR